MTTAILTQQEIRDQLIWDIAESTPQAIYYWGAITIEGKTITIRDDSYGENFTFSFDEYEAAMKTWAKTVKPEHMKFFRTTAAHMLAGFWEDVDYDTVVMDEIAQIACHKKLVYA